MIPGSHSMRRRDGAGLWLNSRHRQQVRNRQARRDDSISNRQQALQHAP